MTSGTQSEKENAKAAIEKFKRAAAERGESIEGL